MKIIDRVGNPKNTLNTLTLQVVLNVHTSYHSPNTKHAML